MALYTRESRDRVRDATDFVELVGARTELRRAGPSRYEGLCPFHEERTPSFGIDPHQKVYYCFGCQASGDLFTFVQETEGVDFKGALELLADRAGIELAREQEDPHELEIRRRRERLSSLLSRALAYYERVLWQSPQAAFAREYLASRGLSEQTLRAFNVGYAPSEWDRVLQASLRSGYSEAELLQVGLAQRSREGGRMHDRFRERVMFPLADVRGRVLGFGARTLRDRAGPKYLNSTDNEIYKKGMHLYGAHRARSHAAKAGTVILCEGYTDVIAMHQAGLRNTVGLMGTALTVQQVAQLSRLAPVIVLALDADSAGQEAMLKAAQVATERKLELRVAQLPPGADPAQLIYEQGPEAMHTAIAGSMPFVRFRVLRTLQSGDLESPEGRDKMIEQLRPIFKDIPQSALRLDLARLIADRLALSESLLDSLLAQAPQMIAGAQRRAERHGAPSRPGPQPEPARSVLSRRTQVERAFLALCIALPDPGEQALKRLRPGEQITDEMLRRVAVHLTGHGLADPMRDIDEKDVQMGRTVAALIVEAGASGATEAMLAVCELQLELAHIDRLIQAARSAGSGEVTALARRRAVVKADLDRAQELALEER